MHDLSGFDKAAREAVVEAERHARRLRHDHVGTEHLLLALLADETSPAAKALLANGLTASGARRKVVEAVGPSDSVPASEAIPSTTRATTAIARAARFAHERQAARVSTKHLLLGVLDVEGRAGQVLRGCGVDVDRLRTALDSSGSRARQRAGPAKAGAAQSGPTCPRCSMQLTGSLRYHRVAASGQQGARDVIVVSCSGCGTALSAFPPRPLTAQS